MTDLSPAAQAVLDAYQFAPIEDELTAAAVLRAVVKQLGYSNVPEEFAHQRPLVIDSDELLAIATELELAEKGAIVQSIAEQEQQIHTYYEALAAQHPGQCTFHKDESDLRLGN